MHDPIALALALDLPALRDGRVGLLCNMTAWSGTRGAYLWELFHAERDLVRVFAPEHGLFAELQDQLPQESSAYASMLGETEIVSLYGATEDSLAVSAEHLADVDVLVVDLQDVGSRYYTFATTLSYVFDRLVEMAKHMDVVVLDRPNPCGRYVEGVALPSDYTSFVGRAGLPHRHGLSVAELARFYAEESGADVTLHPIRHPRPFGGAAWCSGVSPSPNMPTPGTARVYPGGCLLEGSNLSEGRGTTRPFELFGAPWLEGHLQRADVPQEYGAQLRPTRFVPTFHKHANELCFGWQIHVLDAGYASLRHTLRLLRWIRESCPEFAWREDEYEFRSDRPAIELLAGDPVLLDFLRGERGEDVLVPRLEEGARAWMRRADAYRIYDEGFLEAGTAS